MKINEGLRPNDLKGMLKNIIGVDEYESKIDDSAVVISFMITDRNAAQDANRFIQKSYVDLLDSEVSGAPDQNGNYLLFVELPMNSKVAQASQDLCRDLASLGAIGDWEVNVRGSEPSAGISVKDIASIIDQNLEQTLAEFFKQGNSMLREGLNSISFDKTTLGVEAYGDQQSLLNKYRNYKTPTLSLEERTLIKELKVQLGDGWIVKRLNEYLLLKGPNSDKVLLASVTSSNDK